MINNPNILEETLENFNKVPEEIIKESIKEVTMNDEEAIEILKGYLEYPEMDSIEIMKESIETVLNLIEKQKQQISNLETAGQVLEKVYKAEIEKQKERIEYLERSISRKEHSLVEEEQDNVELKTKLQEKDKMIDLMLNEMAFNHNINSIVDVLTIKRQLKEKFENKVKESK